MERQNRKPLARCFVGFSWIFFSWERRHTHKLNVGAHVGANAGANVGANVSDARLVAEARKTAVLDRVRHPRSPFGLWRRRPSHVRRVGLALSVLGLGLSAGLSAGEWSAGLGVCHVPEGLARAFPAIAGAGGLLPRRLTC